MKCFVVSWEFNNTERRITYYPFKHRLHVLGENVKHIKSVKVYYINHFLYLPLDTNGKKQFDVKPLTSFFLI